LNRPPEAFSLSLLIKELNSVADLDAFIRGLPKAELHMHLEGSIEPQLMLDLARRNAIKLRWETKEQLRAAYQFTNLQSFLDLYFEGCRVLVTQQDFYDVTRAYLRRASQDGVIRAEIFFGPQSFSQRGVAIEVMMDGILEGIDDGSRQHGISVGLLVSAHRHRSEADALAMLDQVMPWADRIAGIGMGGPEVGNPPSGFVRFFQAARDRGFRTTVHAGEEGPPAYIREAVALLKVERIDHGVTCMSDPALVRELAERQIPLTVCPLSNARLKVVPALEQHPLPAMLAAGLNVSINSDDPAYFGGYIGDNYSECARVLRLTSDDLVTIAANSIRSSFLPQHEKDQLLTALPRADA
jgi:adenosine deaminase